MERFSVLRTDLLPKVPGAHSSEYRLSFETCCDGFLRPFVHVELILSRSRCGRRMRCNRSVKASFINIGLLHAT